MKKPITIIFSLFGIILLLTIVQVIVSNTLSTTGIELSKAQQAIKEFRRENAVLSEQVLVATSLTQIASSSAQVGFVEATAHVYLDTKVPVAAIR